MINKNPTNDDSINDDSINDDITNEDTIKESPWAIFLRIIKIIFKVYLGNRTTRHIVECIQLTVIYFLAFIVLSYAIQGYLGGFPESVFFFFPRLQDILMNPYMKFFSMPEKTFLLYLIILELLVSKNRYGFSLLVKYNILLVFLLEMLQNIAISYWDLFINREVEYAYIGEIGVHVYDIAHFFFMLLYIMTVITYGYCYLRSIFGRFPVFIGKTAFITDSVAFWLKIKIPKKGKGKGKLKGNKKRR
jgi:hypothetical protein